MGTTALDVAQLTQLRERIAAMQQRRATPRARPVPGPLTTLFPESGLRVGVAYALARGETGLLLSLMAESSLEGEWCCVVGIPELSVEAAAGYGIDLDRLVLIPEPGERWLQAASAACEVFPMVALRVPTRVAPGEAGRLEARLRDRGSTLLAVGDWPGAEAELSVTAHEWRGIGEGHGLLSGRAVTVRAAHRRAPRPRAARLLLPGPTGAVAPLPGASLPGASALQEGRPGNPSDAPPEIGATRRDRPPLRAVGA